MVLHGDGGEDEEEREGDGEDGAGVGVTAVAVAAAGARAAAAAAAGDERGEREGGEPDGRDNEHRRRAEPDRLRARAATSIAKLDGVSIKNQAGRTVEHQGDRIAS